MIDLLWSEENFTTKSNIFKLKILLYSNWGSYYSRYFWCCLANLLAYRIMKEYIYINMNNMNNNNSPLNHYSKEMTKIWFKICKKYNLVLFITFYNFKTRKADPGICLPTRDFKKPINSFYNVLYTPTILYNNKYNKRLIPYDDILDTLSDYSE